MTIHVRHVTCGRRPNSHVQCRLDDLQNRIKHEKLASHNFNLIRLLMHFNTNQLKKKIESFYYKNKVKYIL